MLRRSPSKTYVQIRHGSIDGVPADYDLPVKSYFEQVHRVSEFGGLNLVKTPFQGGHDRTLTFLELHTS
jgi:hypothetical protein